MKLGEVRKKEVVERNGIPYGNLSDTNCQGMYYVSNKEVEGKAEEEIKTRTVEIIGEALGSISNDGRANIARYIRDKKDVKFEELRKEFNLNNNTLTFHLKKLQDAYIISQEKNRGSYRLGQLGEVVLEYLEALENNLSPRIRKILS